jgi:hypothetical protein
MYWQRANVRFGSLSTDLAGLAYRSMSASLRKRPSRYPDDLQNLSFQASRTHARCQSGALFAATMFITNTTGHSAAAVRRSQMSSEKNSLNWRKQTGRKK